MCDPPPLIFVFIAFENHRIFSRYSLVYLLPFVYIIFLPFTLYFVSFFCTILLCLYNVLFIHSIRKVFFPSILSQFLSFVILLYSLTICGFTPP